MGREYIVATSPDPRVAVVAEAMVAFDKSRDEKTWRELAAVAVSALDQWHAFNDPRLVGLSPGEKARIAQEWLESQGYSFTGATSE